MLPQPLLELEGFTSQAHGDEQEMHFAASFSTLEPLCSRSTFMLAKVAFIWVPPASGCRAVPASERARAVSLVFGSLNVGSVAG